MIKYIAFNLILLSLIYQTQVVAEPSEQLSEKVQVLPNYTLKLSMDTTASRATIWEFWSNIEKWHLYDTIVENVELKDDAPFTQGTVGYVDTTKAARTRFTLIEVTEGVSFTEKLHVPLGQSILLKRYFEPAPPIADGEPPLTRFTHEVVFKGRLKSIIYFLAGKTFKKEMPLVMARLRDIAEKAELAEENKK